MSNFETLVQKLQNNKIRLFQNKEELTNIIKSFDIAGEISTEIKDNNNKPNKNTFLNNDQNKDKLVEITKEQALVNSLDQMIGKLADKHGFSFELSEKHEIFRERENINIQPVEDVITRIKNKLLSLFIFNFYSYYRVFNKNTEFFESKPTENIENKDNNEKIEQIKQKIFQKNKISDEKIFIQKKAISPPKIPIIKNSSDLFLQNSLNISNFLNFSPEKEVDIIQKPLENTLLFTKEKKPIIQQKTMNFKEKIRKLKEVYYDKEFLNYFDNEKKENSKSSEKENLTPKSKNPSLTKNEFIQSIEKNSSIMKKIDFESSLNYSISQRSDSPLMKSTITDPILTNLYSELGNLTAELE